VAFEIRGVFAAVVKILKVNVTNLMRTDKEIKRKKGRRRRKRRNGAAAMKRGGSYLKVR